MFIRHSRDTKNYGNKRGVVVLLYTKNKQKCCYCSFRFSTGKNCELYSEHCFRFMTDGVKLHPFWFSLFSFFFTWLIILTCDPTEFLGKDIPTTAPSMMNKNQTYFFSLLHHFVLKHVRFFLKDTTNFRRLQRHLSWTGKGFRQNPRTFVA